MNGYSIYNKQQTSDLDVELIKRLFIYMKKLDLSEMIEIHKRFKTSNKYEEEEYSEMISHLTD